VTTVPRRRRPDRLDTIVAAALATFTGAGYRRARMTDVAAAAGVSPGLLYTYAESKEALFALVIRREAGVDLATLPLPVATPTETELLALVRGTVAEVGATPLLDAARADPRPADVVAEVGRVMGEQFDGITRLRTLLRLVERCATDWPMLAQEFYDGVRRPHLDRLQEYVSTRSDAGLIAPLTDPAIAARFVMETIAWFANHRFGDHDGAQLDDDRVRAEVIELLTRALVGR
jgi:AcrR family transcriptional regulator